jgi:hypothetical protein
MTLLRVIFTGAHWEIFATQIVAVFDDQRPSAREGSRTKIATVGNPDGTSTNSGKLLETRSVYRSTIAQRFAPSPYRPELKPKLAGLEVTHQRRQHRAQILARPASPQHLVKA